MATYMIVGAIAVYAIYIVQRKIRDWRQGKFCGCGCQSCAGKPACNRFIENTHHQEEKKAR